MNFDPNYKKDFKELMILPDQRKQFLFFSELSNSPIIFLSLDYKVVDFNKIASEIFGWNTEEIVNQSFLTWCEKNKIVTPFHQQGNTIFHNNLPALNIQTWVNEYFIQWNIVPNIDQKGNLREIVLIGNNITADKIYRDQMEELSVKSKKLVGYDVGAEAKVSADEYLSAVYSYFEKIIISLPCIVFWKDRNFVYLNCNELSLKMLNLKSREEVIGKTEYDFGFNIERANQIRKDDEEIVRTKLPQLNVEHPLEFDDGREYVFLMSKVPILDESGEVIGLAGIMMDITERKKNEREIIKAKEQAIAANKLKTEFVRNLDHDIRTPFSGILGMTKILSSLETDGNKKQIINDISSSAQELLDYCSSVLNFSRIESGVIPETIKKFSLKALLNRITNIEKPAAKIKELDYSVESGSDVPDIIIGDVYRLERILINLVSNAIKFTKKGYIRLVVKKISKKSNRDIILSFIVEDSGIGIPLDKQDIIFEKFCRITPSHHGSYKGQGLGLHIVKQFVAEMEGDIEVESDLGKGSRFICTLPFKIPLIERK